MAETDFDTAHAESDPAYLSGLSNHRPLNRGSCEVEIWWTGWGDQFEHDPRQMGPEIICGICLITDFRTAVPAVFKFGIRWWNPSPQTRCRANGTEILCGVGLITAFEQLCLRFALSTPLTMAVV